ncbi:MAG: flippase-like domain-containing protein [Deltaproteobacteria bacterium]|nr:flippase-like domain-containing protein [Deltaproteobacteria bacterium]
MSASPVVSYSPLLRWLRNLGPWLLAALILYWIFNQVPLGEAWTAASNADLRLFIPTTLMAVGYWFLLESRAFAFLFTRFNTPLRWAEARSLRGVTYLLTPINWNLGTAAIIMHLRITRGVGAVDATSSILFYGSLDAVILASEVFLGAALLPASPMTSAMLRISGAIVILQSLFVATLMTRRPAWRPLNWLRGRRIFGTFARAHPRDLLVLGLVRVAYFAGFIGFFWFGAKSFHIDVPFAFAAVVTPIVMLAGALPITPAGLGTQQATMLYFFEPYGVEGSVLAFGLAFPVALILARLPIGFLYGRELGTFRHYLEKARTSDASE